MDSLIVKRSIIINGHKTSVSLEDAFWSGLRRIAQDKDTTLSNMVGEIDLNRRNGNLSSSIRLFVLNHVRTQVSGISEDRVGATMMNGGSLQNYG